TSGFLRQGHPAASMTIEPDGDPAVGRPGATIGGGSVSLVGLHAIGRYRVLRPLGAGGMGQVFLARDADLDRDVALKLLHGDDDPTKRERFRAEARSIAALRHPGIVTIYEIAEHAGRQFIAMEYLPGRSMRELIEVGEAQQVLIA